LQIQLDEASKILYDNLRGCCDNIEKSYVDMLVLAAKPSLTADELKPLMITANKHMNAAKPTYDRCCTMLSTVNKKRKRSRACAGSVM
jgi:hypothetical protein